MVALVGAHFLNSIQNAGIAIQRGDMELKMTDKVIYTPESVLRVLKRDSAHRAMNLIALVQEEFGQVGTVLAINARY